MYLDRERQGNQILSHHLLVMVPRDGTEATTKNGPWSLALGVWCVRKSPKTILCFSKNLPVPRRSFQDLSAWLQQLCRRKKINNQPDQPLILHDRVRFLIRS